MLSVAGILSTLVGTPFKLAANVGLSAVSAFVVAGAEAVLHVVVSVISAVTTPSLRASWFSPMYWRIAALAALLTLPFLFAAAVQAIVRSDPGILLRAAFVDLPVATVAVSLAAPLIGLALAATDEMCSLVTGAGPGSGGILARTALLLPALHGGFLVVVVAGVIVIAGVVLAVELVLRSAAIYVVVLFLPLGFAAMVWPARRVWIKRMLEFLISLILAKFAMVAVLALSVAGLTSVSVGAGSIEAALSAMAMMLLAAGSPWMLLRLLPFTEVAAGLGSALHVEAARSLDPQGHSGRLLPGPGAMMAPFGPDVAGGAVLALGRQLTGAGPRSASSDPESTGERPSGEQAAQTAPTPGTAVGDDRSDAGARPGPTGAFEAVASSAPRPAAGTTTDLTATVPVPDRGAGPVPGPPPPTPGADARPPLHHVIPLMDPARAEHEVNLSNDGRPFELPPGFAAGPTEPGLGDGDAEEPR